MSQVATQSKALTLEQVLIGGDLAKLSPEQRIEYYNRVCETCSLNPLTQPFTYMTLNGKLVLYANRSCTDQLRFVRGVSVEETSEAERDGVFIVTAKVKDRDGRTDIARGAVNIGNLKGESLANAIMKAETKAKRRATLSICGLSMLDEIELDTIPANAKGTAPQPQLSPPPAPKPNGNGGAHIVPNVADREGALSEADERKLDRQSMRDMRHETPEHDEETGETGPRMLNPETTPQGTKWTLWGERLIGAFKAAANVDELSEWLTINGDYLDVCEKEAPRAAASVQKAYKATAETLRNKPNAAPASNAEPLPFA